MQKLKKLRETRRNLRKNRKGFTLVELLVVLAILAILIAVAVPTLTGVLDDAKDKTYLQEARAAYIAYLLKATDATKPGDVTLANIESYTGTEAGAISVTLRLSGSNASDIAYFYYAPKAWTTSSSGATTAAKHIEMPLTTGGTTKGTIVSGAIPTTANTGSDSLSDQAPIALS